ncbi:MAG: hypothetical protein WAV89_01435 [Ignavibacteriaceae bacterium]
MKSKIILLLFILQWIALPQTNFIQQITNGDFDARNPFIYKNSYGFYGELYFELHKNDYSNIYSIKYNSDTGQFEDTVSLTSGKVFNINPSFKLNIGLLYQTNQNGNWDIVLIPDSDGVLGKPKFLTNSGNDEELPRFFETTSSWGDSTRILFEREGKIVYLSIDQDNINETTIFQNDSNITYTNFVGLQTDGWNSKSGFYVFAIEDSSNYKKIVEKFKPFNGTWKEKITLKDNCDCDDLSVQISDYNFWGLFYSDTTLFERRFFTIQDPFSSNITSELVELKPEGNLFSFDLYAMLLVGKRNLDNSEKFYEPYFPYTFIVENEGKVKIRTDLAELGFWGEDSLIQTSVIKPNLAIDL